MENIKLFLSSGFVEETYLEDAGQLKRRSVEHLNNIPEEDIYGRLELWKTRQDECIRTNEDYFEGTKAVLPPITRSSKLYTQYRVFVKLFLLLTAIVSELEQLTHDSSKKQKNLDK